MRFKHFVGDFARLLYGAVHNLSNVTSRIHKCPQNRISDARPQHRELNALNTEKVHLLIQISQEKAGEWKRETDSDQVGCLARSIAAIWELRNVSTELEKLSIGLEYASRSKRKWPSMEFATSTKTAKSKSLCYPIRYLIDRGKSWQKTCLCYLKENLWCESIITSSILN